ncbi:hypothetical protein GOBAR_DD24151 [Gossypium barbadense]|nr:hypothetical protein GOBAR_DD24151 [Gossypium barbadense]
MIELFLTDNSKKRLIGQEITKGGKGNVIFRYREICTATNNFNPRNQIGEGGFGRVYKGLIENSNKVVAVKQLDKNGYQGNREFLVELLMLVLLKHPNLVELVGYCIEGDQRILVYEYMANGSLEDHLIDLPPNKMPLDWNTRIKIAVGAAKGLEYMHEIANPQVIYRDFKTSNILLDQDFNPKLSDFGLAKLWGRVFGAHHRKKSGRQFKTTTRKESCFLGPPPRTYGCSNVSAGRTVSSAIDELRRKVPQVLNYIQ